MNAWTLGLIVLIVGLLLTTALYIMAEQAKEIEALRRELRNKSAQLTKFNAQRFDSLRRKVS